MPHPPSTPSTRKSRSNDWALPQYPPLLCEAERRSRSGREAWTEKHGQKMMEGRALRTWTADDKAAASLRMKTKWKEGDAFKFRLDWSQLDPVLLAGVDKGTPWKVLAKKLGVSLGTLTRRRRKLGLTAKALAHPSDVDVVGAIEAGLESAMLAVEAMPKGWNAWDAKAYTIAEVAARAAVKDVLRRMGKEKDAEGRLVRR